tara:strand:- start:1195 stop:1638 length:444 start_codon:yes stop_codon:yes gene_type:complete
MSLIKLLKGVGIGAGAGMGTMYLVNEEKGGTFTSYPREARYKRLLRGEQIPLPGLEDYVYSGHRDWLKDRFGFGNKLNKADIEKKRNAWDIKIKQVELANDLSSLSNDDLDELFKWYKYPRSDRLIDYERSIEYSNRVLSEINKRRR